MRTPRVNIIWRMGNRTWSPEQAFAAGVAFRPELSAAFNRVLNAPDATERLLGQGVEAAGGTPGQLAALTRGTSMHLARLAFCRRPGYELPQQACACRGRRNQERDIAGRDDHLHPHPTAASHVGIASDTSSAHPFAVATAGGHDFLEHRQYARVLELTM